MTEAFSEFMRQYKMTGSEKADGYSKNVFLGLEPSEKEEVFRLLMTELPYSVNWLFFLNAEKALVIAKEMEEKLRGNAYASVYMLQEQIVRHAGELAYQAHMIEDYPGYIKTLKPLVIDAISRTPANKNIISFFENVILTEADSSAVARAARALLAAVKMPRITAAEEICYRHTVNELCSDSVDVKLRAIRQLLKYKAGSQQ